MPDRACALGDGELFVPEHWFADQITSSMLSWHDLIDILRHELPSKLKTDDDMAAMIEERHRLCLEAMQSAYQKTG